MTTHDFSDLTPPINLWDGTTENQKDCIFAAARWGAEQAAERLAKQERKLMSARTKAGLAAARARGVKLGGARLGLEARNAARIAKAEAEAERLRPVLEPLVALGYSLTRIGDELARHGHLTKGGKGIAPAQVRRYLERLGLMTQQAKPLTRALEADS